MTKKKEKKIQSIDKKKDFSTTSARTKEADSFADDLSSFLESSCKLEVQTLSERDTVPYFIDSGSYALNWIIGNSFFDGVPGTKSVLIAGESEKGKSLISDVWLGQNIRNGGLSFKVDIEDAGGFQFTSQIVGSDEVAKRIRLISPKMLAKGKKDLDPADLIITIERLTTILNKLIDYQISKGKDKNPSVMITIDSVSQLSSTKEITDIRGEKDKRDMTAQQKMRALFRAITQTQRASNVTIIGIAHLTANIGVIFGDSKIINAKGTGFGYASSLTLQAMSSKELVDPKSGVPIGIRLKFKTKKNRIAFKGRVSFLYLYFNRGVDPYGGIAELLAQYDLAKTSAKPAMDGSYKDSVFFTYTTLAGKELKFKAKNTEKIVLENGGDELLKEWDQRVTDAYKNVLQSAGITEEEMLEADGMEETSGLEEEVAESEEELVEEIKEKIKKKSKKKK